MNFHYCEKCKEDWHRVSLGYKAKPEDCGHWECHLYDTLNLIGSIILMVPILIIMLPVLIFVFIINKINLDGL